MPGKSHEQRSLTGYSAWGLEVSDTVEGVTLSLFTFTDYLGIILRVTVEKNVVTEKPKMPALPRPVTTGLLVNL